MRGLWVLPVADGSFVVVWFVGSFVVLSRVFNDRPRGTYIIV